MPALPRIQLSDDTTPVPAQSPNIPLAAPGQSLQHKRSLLEGALRAMVPRRSAQPDSNRPTGRNETGLVMSGSGVPSGSKSATEASASTRPLDDAQPKPGHFRKSKAHLNELRQKFSGLMSGKKEKRTARFDRDLDGAYTPMIAAPKASSSRYGADRIPDADPNRDDGRGDSLDSATMEAIGINKALWARERFFLRRSDDQGESAAQHLHQQDKDAPVHVSGVDATGISKSDLETARQVFANATVVNLTNVQHQFFSSIQTDMFGEKIESVTPRSTPILDHIVNKWERAEQGEVLTGYEGSGQTDIHEAVQLGVEPHEYRKLPSREKMQFAVLNYRDDIDYLSARGWGRSYFVINKEKCVHDGYLHFGDSGVDGFSGSRGDFRTFPDRLKDDSHAVRLLNQNMREGEPTPEWIEVNLKGGVTLPDDIDKFVVSELELEEMKNYIPVAQAKALLNARFAGKIEYR